MSDNKINITSTLLEKGVDIAKDFVDKLISPSVEETGLLLKDKISFWRFSNQIKTLVKAKEICAKNNISTKQISLKLLCPLLEYSSLEEDEFLTDKWAALLSNLVDSEQNIQNHVFPYILSQISRKEFQILENVYDDKDNRLSIVREDLSYFYQHKERIEEDHKSEVSEIDRKIAMFEDTDGLSNYHLTKLFREKSAILSKLSSYKHKESILKYSLDKLESIPTGSFEKFELSNLLRLGLIKEEKEFYANSQTLKIPNDRDEYETHTSIDLEIDVHSDTDYYMTEFGELFIRLCKEKLQVI